jgi:RimJ/RimL family protein N-acetyltransferase
MKNIARLKHLVNSLCTHGVKTSTHLLKQQLNSYVEQKFTRILWGERLGLRSIHSPLTQAELEQVYHWAKDEEVLLLSGGSPTIQTFEEFIRQVEQERKKFQPNQILFYIVNRSGELIGRVGLYSIDWTKLEGEYGITLEKKYWSQHYGREAARFFQSYIFSQTPIRRIFLGTFADNFRAQRSFEAAGFRKIGTEEKYFPQLGKTIEGIAMEILRSEFYSISNEKDSLV